MPFQFKKPKEPVLDPRTEEQKLENIILYVGELLNHEIQRGNELCEIIYSLMEHDGPSHLTQDQKDRIIRIKSAIEGQKTWLSRD